MKDTWFRMKKHEGEHYLWFAYFDDKGNDNGEEYIVDFAGYKELCRYFDVDRKDPESLLIRLRQDHGDRCDFIEFLEEQGIQYARVGTTSVVWKNIDQECYTVYNFVYGEDDDVILLNHIGSDGLVLNGSRTLVTTDKHRLKPQIAKTIVDGF